MLYKKLDVPEIEVIINEILPLVSPQISQNLRFWDFSSATAYQHCPNLVVYIFKNFYSFPVLIRFYNTPPFGELVPHIDNVDDAKNKIALNIPIYGTKNTLMNYYNSTEENTYLTHTGGKSHLPVQVIKDKNKIELIDSLELDRPALVRTDVIHGVKNNNNTYRLIMSLKFIGNSFEEVYKGTN